MFDHASKGAINNAGVKRQLERAVEVAAYMKRHLWELRTADPAAYLAIMRAFPRPQLMAALSSNELVVDSELQTYLMLLVWKQHHPNEFNLPDFFDCVRASSMPLSDLNKLLERYPPLRELPQVEDKLEYSWRRPLNEPPKPRPSSCNVVWPLLSDFKYLLDGTKRSPTFEFGGGEWYAPQMRCMV